MTELVFSIAAVLLLILTREAGRLSSYRTDEVKKELGIVLSVIAACLWLILTFVVWIMIGLQKIADHDWALYPLVLGGVLAAVYCLSFFMRRFVADARRQAAKKS
jgi:uncharacterized membrane protein